MSRVNKYAESMMAEAKTKKNKASVKAFLKSIGAFDKAIDKNMNKLYPVSN
ncbi:MAG: hypothetical protein JKY88_02730 [Pseudomonadales bacterium]|nr:hypothetical protein [Pseudomonadales bacterium]